MSNFEPIQRLRSKSPATELFRILAPIVVFAGGIGAFYILSSFKETPALDNSQPRPPLVETVTPLPYGGGVNIEVDGLVVPFREIEISAEVGGRIKHTAEICKPGNYVEEGTLLVEIDPVDYQLEVSRLAKELEQAKVTLTEMDVEISNNEKLLELGQAEVDVQKRELKRLQDLVEDGAVTESQVDQAIRAEITARNQLLKISNMHRLLKTRKTRLEHARQLVETQLEKAHLDEKRTKIFAPISGVIVFEIAEQDSYVKAGTHLVTVEDTSAVEVKCNLRMDQLHWLWQQSGSTPEREDRRGYQIPQTSASVVYELNGNEYVWKGRLTRFDGIGVDETTRTVPCRVKVEDPRDVQMPDDMDGGQSSSGPPALVRGMFVRVIIHAQPDISLVKVPEAAILPGSMVWLVDNDTLKQHKVKIVQFTRDGVLLDADRLGSNATLPMVTSPMPYARDGQLVRHQMTPMDGQDTIQEVEIVGDKRSNRRLPAVRNL